VRYIHDQQEHHRKAGFIQEYRNLLDRITSVLYTMKNTCLQNRNKPILKWLMEQRPTGLQLHFRFFCYKAVAPLGPGGGCRTQCSDQSKRRTNFSGYKAVHYGTMAWSQDNAFRLTGKNTSTFVAIEHWSRRLPLGSIKIPLCLFFSAYLDLPKPHCQ
jgi:hypothetical protein